MFALFHSDFMGVAGIPGVDQWIFDSGASSHASNNLEHFKNMSRNVPFKRIKVGNGQHAAVEGIGDVTLAELAQELV